jgi:hypothetical protein
MQGLGMARAIYPDLANDAVSVSAYVNVSGQEEDDIGVEAVLLNMSIEVIFFRVSDRQQRLNHRACQKGR